MECRTTKAISRHANKRDCFAHTPLCVTLAMNSLRKHPSSELETVREPKTIINPHPDPGLGGENKVDLSILGSLIPFIIHNYYEHDSSIPFSGMAVLHACRG